jgi:hypothetical protein
MNAAKLVLIAAVARLSFAAAPPDYPVRPIGEYDNARVKMGLRVVAFALDSKEQKTYFDRDMTAKGVLPVLVVLKNESGSDSFALRKRDIAYTDPSKNIVTGKALLNSAIPVAGVFMAVHAIEKELEYNMTLFRRELQSLTLSPGSTSSGFLYVPLPKAASSGKPAGRGKVLLNLRMLHLASGDTVDFDFELPAN